MSVSGLFEAEMFVRLLQPQMRIAVFLSTCSPSAQIAVGSNRFTSAADPFSGSASRRQWRNVGDRVGCAGLAKDGFYFQVEQQNARVP